MADLRNLIVFDLETTSPIPSECEVLEIGSLAINPYNLTIEGEFHSLVKPEECLDENGKVVLNPKITELTGIKGEDLDEAPSAQLVFKNWVSWINKYNPSKNNSNYKAPIACGWNVKNFDLPIVDRYFRKFKYWDEKKNWRKPFNPIFAFDAMDFMWWLLRNNADLNSISQPTVLEYMGIDKGEVKEKAHGALWDAQQTTRIVIKLLKLGLFLTDFKEDGNRRLEIKGCLSNG